MEVHAVIFEYSFTYWADHIVCLLKGTFLQNNSTPVFT